MTDAIGKLPPIPGLTGTQPIQPTTEPSRSGAARGTDFQTVFEQELGQSKPLSFSAHAQSRLLSRQISLTEPQMQRLQQGVQSAAGKGARESLVLMDNLAFVVSVKNRTVITAVDGAAQSGNVFTQIDSAVIV
ncbi:MAG: hypothetical protein PHI18_05675 [bacterium]|nr:hypothetical protein [bacterium]